MLDTNLANSLLTTSRRLATAKASNASLRRAISTAYYAVFHALARSCADALVGDKASLRPNKAWVEVYRGLAHGPSKRSCQDASEIAFPTELHDFSDTFVQLQEARERADYDPTFEISREQTLIYLDVAETAIRTLRSVRKTDRRAFATWVLITTRGAQHARKLSRSGK